MEKPKSNKNQKKEHNESLVLSRAASTLRSIYKNYDIDPIQKDRPDKAIILKKPRARLIREQTKPVTIGIEITTVDPSSFLSYMNDRKRDKEIEAAQIDEVMETGEAPTRPLKKISSTIYDAWLYDGLKAKSKKYESYNFSGKFNELILLCHSDIISVEELKSEKSLLEWTQYLLQEDSYPFDKVIFVDSNHNKAIQIYNKLKKVKKPRNKSKDGETQSIEYGFLPVNKTINLKEIASRAPIIAPPEQIVDRRNDDT